MVVTGPQRVFGIDGTDRHVLDPSPETSEAQDVLNPLSCYRDKPEVSQSCKFFCDES